MAILTYQLFDNILLLICNILLFKYFKKNIKEFLKLFFLNVIIVTLYKNFSKVKKTVKINFKNVILLKYNNIFFLLI